MKEGLFIQLASPIFRAVRKLTDESLMSPAMFPRMWSPADHRAGRPAATTSFLLAHSSRVAISQLSQSRRLIVSRRSVPPRTFLTIDSPGESPDDRSYVHQCLANTDNHVHRLLRDHLLTVREYSAITSERTWRYSAAYVMGVSNREQ